MIGVGELWNTPCYREAWERVCNGEIRNTQEFEWHSPFERAPFIQTCKVQTAPAKSCDRIYVVFNWYAILSIVLFG